MVFRKLIAGPVLISTLLTIGCATRNPDVPKNFNFEEINPASISAEYRSLLTKQAEEGLGWADSNLLYSIKQYKAALKSEDPETYKAFFVTPPDD